MGVSGFDEVFEIHQGRILRLCWLLTLDGDVAAEVAQETFARAWRDRKLLETEGVDAGAWLRRVAVNLCWDRSRRRASRRRRGHLVASPARAAAVEVDVDLHRAIARLSSRQRQVVVLRYWDDLDLASCAAVMGISLGSVKQHLARAHAGLAKAPELARGGPMTTGFYDDLGERLDRLADASVGDVELSHPSDLNLTPAEPRHLGVRLVMAGIAAALVLIVVLMLQGGPDVVTEDPVDGPDSPATVPLIDLLAEWASIPTSEEIARPFADLDLSQEFDVSTLRQIEFELGTVLVGLDPERSRLMVGLSSRGTDGGMALSGLRLPDLIGRGATVVVGFSAPGGQKMVGGVARRGVVAVNLNGEPVEFRSGAFLASAEDLPLGLPGSLEAIEFVFADGTTEPTSRGVDGATGASGTLSANFEGTSVDKPLDSVACARMVGDPMVLDIAGSAGTVGDGDFYDINLHNGDLNIVVLRDENSLGDRVDASDLSVRFIDDPPRSDIEWNTERSSGHISVVCAEPIIDATELIDLLRAP